MNELGKDCGTPNVCTEEQIWANFSVINQNEWRQTELVQLQWLRMKCELKKLWVLTSAQCRDDPKAIKRKGHRMKKLLKRKGKLRCFSGGGKTTRRRKVFMDATGHLFRDCNIAEDHRQKKEGHLNPLWRKRKWEKLSREVIRERGYRKWDDSCWVLNCSNQKIQCKGWEEIDLEAKEKCRKRNSPRETKITFKGCLLQIKITKFIIFMTHY